MHPILSVIIPAFNEEKNLAKTISAVKKSIAFAKISTEIIVVNNNSSDATGKVAKKLADVVCIEKRHIIAAVRNTGAKHSRGVYLLFIDADTIIPVQLVRDFVNTLRTRAVTVGCNVMPFPLNSIERNLFKAFNLILRSSSHHGAAFSGNCVGYRKDIFQKLGGFDEGRIASEDHDLSNRASKLGKAVFLKHLTVKTSNRRVKNLGLPLMLMGWSKTTLFYLFGLKRKKYRITR